MKARAFCRPREENEQCHSSPWVFVQLLAPRGRVQPSCFCPSNPEEVVGVKGSCKANPEGIPEGSHPRRLDLQLYSEKLCSL